MKVKQIASNMVEVEMGDKIVLVSYQTPVACFVEGKGYFRTEKKWSVTTSKHIRKWLAVNGVQGTTKEKPQEFFDNLLA